MHIKYFQTLNKKVAFYYLLSNLFKSKNHTDQYEHVTNVKFLSFLCLNNKFFRSFINK
jgi:hypothetical protein